MTTDNAQQQLEEVLVKTYLSNLSFLKDCDRTLYERLESLSLMIEQGLYKERFHLEFIQEQGEFDIFDEKAQKYIYNKKPKQMIRKFINSVEFNRKGSLSLFEPLLFVKQPEVYAVKYDKETIQDYRWGLIKLHHDLKPYLEILNADIKDNKKKLKTIDKFMFIGTSLGRHIPGMIEKVKARHYFVHEPNLEIFRLSLFVVDYTLFLSNQASVYFSIMEEGPIFENKLYEYYKLNTWENHTIKFHTTDYGVDKSFESVMNAIIPAKPTLFGYNMMLYCVTRNLSERINKYRFLYFPLVNHLELFQEKPVIYVCAGPSLEDNIAWLKQNQNKFIVATIGAAYKKLLNEDIFPDIIITLDGNYEILNRLQFDEENTKKIQESVVIASAFTDEKILKRFNPSKLYLYETMISFSKRSQPLKGHSVGEMGYRILLELGAKELYLLGTDLAIHQTKGSSHSATSGSNAIDYDLNNIVSSEETKSFSLTNELVRVKGNMLEQVYTTRVLNTSLLDYSKVEKHSWQNVYNLCTHGAYIHETIPTSIEDLDMSKFETFKSEQPVFIDKMNDLIKTVASEKINQEDREFLNQMSEAVASLLENVKVLMNKEYTYYEEFREDFILLFKQVLVIKEVLENQSLSAIVSLFYAMITPYIDYAFNDTKVKNEQKKLNKVAQVWLQDFYTVLEDLYRYIQKPIQ